MTEGKIKLNPGRCCCDPCPMGNILPEPECLFIGPIEGPGDLDYLWDIDFRKFKGVVPCYYGESKKVFCYPDFVAGSRVIHICSLKTNKTIVGNEIRLVDLERYYTPSFKETWSKIDSFGNEITLIEGATSTYTYTPTIDDVGYRIKAVVQYGNSYAVAITEYPVRIAFVRATMSSKYPLINVPISVVSEPYDVLGDPDDEAAPYNADIQWYRDSFPILGATQKTYVPTREDVGYSLGCEITAKNDYTGTAFIVANDVSINIESIELSNNSPMIAEPLIVTTVPEKSWRVIRWYRVDDDGNEKQVYYGTRGTSSSYTPVEDDIGYYLRAKIIDGNEYIGSGEVTTLRKVVRPMILKLSRHNPEVDTEIEIITEQENYCPNENSVIWERFKGEYSDIVGSGSSYTPVEDDIGYYLRAKITSFSEFSYPCQAVVETSQRVVAISEYEPYVRTGTFLYQGQSVNGTFANKELSDSTVAKDASIEEQDNIIATITPGEDDGYGIPYKYVNGYIQELKPCIQINIWRRCKLEKNSTQNPDGGCSGYYNITTFPVNALTGKMNKYGRVSTEGTGTNWPDRYDFLMNSHPEFSYFLATMTIVQPCTGLTETEWCQDDCNSSGEWETGKVADIIEKLTAETWNECGCTVEYAIRLDIPIKKHMYRAFDVEFDINNTAMYRRYATPGLYLLSDFLESECEVNDDYTTSDAMTVALLCKGENNKYLPVNAVGYLEQKSKSSSSGKIVDRVDVNRISYDLFNDNAGWSHNNVPVAYVDATVSFKENYIGEIPSSPSQAYEILSIEQVVNVVGGKNGVFNIDMIANTVFAAYKSFTMKQYGTGNVYLCAHGPFLDIQDTTIWSHGYSGYEHTNMDSLPTNLDNKTIDIKIRVGFVNRENNCPVSFGYDLDQFKEHVNREVIEELINDGKDDLFYADSTMRVTYINLKT